MNLNQPWSKIPGVGLLFPSFRFSPLSFSFPGDSRMRFSDTPSVYTCFFVLIGFLCFPIFLRWCVLDFSLMLASSCFWKYTYLCTEPFRQRPWENIFTEITSEKLYEHQWYVWKWCGRILFERSQLISVSEWSLSWLSLSFYAVPFP